VLEEDESDTSTDEISSEKMTAKRSRNALENSMLVDAAPIVTHLSSYGALLACE
jgi:hypothetical protein